MSKKYSTVNVLNSFQQILISILTFLFNFILLKNARNFIDMDKVFTKVQWNAVIIQNLEMLSLNFLKNMIKISQKSWEKSRFNNNTFFEMNEKQWCTPFRNNFIKFKKIIVFWTLWSTDRVLEGNRSVPRIVGNGTIAMNFDKHFYTT